MRFRLPFIVLAACILAASSCTQPLPGGFTGGDPVNSARLTMIDWHNQVRFDYGRAPLTYSSRLMEIAQDQAEWNAQLGDLDHHDQYGGDVRDRADAVGYYWADIGENLGYATSGTRVFDDWLNSPGHFSNIIDGAFSEVGVGRATSGAYEFWVVVFGNR